MATATAFFASDADRAQLIAQPEQFVARAEPVLGGLVERLKRREAELRDEVVGALAATWPGHRPPTASLLAGAVTDRVLGFLTHCPAEEEAGRWELVRHSSAPTLTNGHDRKKSNC